MYKIDWIRKLTSRKLWLAIAGLVSGLIMYFGGTEELARKTDGVIMCAASVVAYIIGEGLADSSPTISVAEDKDKGGEE